MQKESPSFFLGAFSSRGRLALPGRPPPAGGSLFLGAFSVLGAAFLCVAFLAAGA